MKKVVRALSCSKEQLRMERVSMKKESKFLISTKFTEENLIQRVKLLLR